MSTKNHVRPVIIILMAIMVSVSFVPVSAFAQSSNITTFLNDSCGLNIKKGIDLGIIDIGLISSEITTIIRTTGTVNSVISITADDWRDGETRATAVITIGGDGIPFPELQSSFIQINGLYYISSFEMPEAFFPGFFHLDKDSDEHTAESLASAINDSFRFRDRLVVVPQQYIFAKAIGNTVILTASVPGLSGNNVPLSFEDPYITFDSDKMYGGKEGITTAHMLSSVTKYAVTIDGSSSAGTSYSEKTSFPSKGVSHILTTDATPAHEISLSLQVSGKNTLFDMPFNGLLFQTLTFTSQCI